MRIKLDRTICDAFGRCAEHAPETFSLDEWGYASLVDRSGDVPPDQEAGVTRALLDCPVHAILLLRTSSEAPAGVRPDPAADGRPAVAAS